jgi:hypothetical protein
MIYFFTFVVMLFAYNSDGSEHTESDAENSPKRECKTTTKLRSLLSNVDKTETVELIVADSILNLFEENENSPDTCYGFPYVDKDNKLFYHFVNKLIALSYHDYRYILRYVELANIINKNVEWSEALTEDLHKIALKNTHGFVLAYKDLETDKREFVLYSLAFLYELDSIKAFNEKLDKLNDPSLQEAIDEIKREIK